MVFKNYYKILGLETNKVTTDEIKIAYRNMAKQYHPDLNGGVVDEEKIKNINEAYQILSKPETKRKYDRAWVSNQRKVLSKQRGDGRETNRNFMEMLFGEGHKEVVKGSKEKLNGEDIDSEITITVEDGFLGNTKKISLRQGNGKVKTFDVKIPEGIRPGDKIKLVGQGKKGVNGGNPGNLVLKVNVEPNNKYTIDKNDLLMNLEITPWEAALGSRIDVKIIKESVEIYIPAGTESGDILRLPEKGYKAKDGSRGNLVVTFKIVVPKRLSSVERNLFEQLKNASKFNPRK